MRSSTRDSGWSVGGWTPSIGLTQTPARAAAASMSARRHSRDLPLICTGDGRLRAHELEHPPAADQIQLAHHYALHPPELLGYHTSVSQRRATGPELHRQS